MTEIKSYSHIDPEIRLEMLVGHFWDQLSPAMGLIEGLKLRSNASTITRAEIQSLLAYAGMLFFELRAIKEEAQSIRAALGKEPPLPHEMEPRIVQLQPEPAA